MATVVLRVFKGEIPRLAPHLLPDENAAYARNCDFSKAHLHPIRGGSVFKHVGTDSWSPNSTVYSFFSKGGGSVMTGDTSRGEQFQSPVIGEIYGRVYSLHLGVFKVYEWNFADLDGNINTQYYVGVPAPTAAPVLTLEALTSIPGHSGATATFRTWYEVSGVKYQEQSVAPTLVTAWEKWTFNATPFATTGDEETDVKLENAKLVAEILVKDGEEVLFRMNTSVGAAVPARTSALPGGIEMTLAKVNADADDQLYEIRLSWGVVETRAYVFTNTNTYNEESAPSPAALISPTYLQRVKINLTGILGVGFSNYRPFQSTNIYRTYGASAAYMRIAPTGASPIFYDDQHTLASTSVLLKSLGWSTPPTPALGGLSSLVLAPTGWFAAASGNTLYMSEPYRPHAWPYSMAFPLDIRGVCVGAQGIVVTTSETAYLVTGPHPASAQQVRLPIPVGGVSHIGMCNVEGAVAYVSEDGIVLVNGSSASLDLSQSLFTREEWRDRYSWILSQLRLSYHDGMLIGTAATGPDAGSGEYGFIIRLDEGGGQFTRYDEHVYSMARLPINDTLYFVPASASYGIDQYRGIYTFGTSSKKTLLWKSKEFVFPRHEGFGVLYVRAVGAVDLTLRGDGNTVATYTGATTGYYRIPPGRYLRWQIEVQATDSVYEVAIAGSVEELKGA